MFIERQVIWCAWECEGFPRLSWIGYCKRWQWVGLKLPGSWEVMTNIISVLLCKPDCIIGCSLYSHNTGASAWWRNLVKFLSVRIKDGENIMTHLAKPDTTCVVNSGSHQPAIGER